MHPAMLSRLCGTSWKQFGKIGFLGLFGLLGFFGFLGFLGILGFFGFFGFFGILGILGLRFAWTGPGAIPLFILKMWLNDFRAGRFQPPLRSPALGIGRDGDSLKPPGRTVPRSHRRQPGCRTANPRRPSGASWRRISDPGLGRKGYGGRCASFDPSVSADSESVRQAFAPLVQSEKRKQPPAISATVSRDAADDSLRRNG